MWLLNANGPTQEAPFCGSPFVMSLQEIMDWQKDKGIDLEVPQIMVHLCEGVLRLNGHSALGIFRSVAMPRGPSLLLLRRG